MAIKVFPSANAVGGAAQKVLSEGNMAGWLAATTPRNYVVSGLDLSGDGTTTLTISPGVAIIAGRAVVVDSPIQIDVSGVVGSGYATCWLALAVDAVGNVTGVTAEISTIASLTANDLPLGQVARSSGVISYIDYSFVRSTSPYGTLYDSMIARHAAFDTYFDSLDGYAISLVPSHEPGTAVINAEEGCLLLATSTENGSAAEIAKYGFADTNSRVRPDFTREQWLCIEGRVEGVATHTASEAWLVVGAPATKRHFGFVSVGGQLFGTIANGITETRTPVLTEGRAYRLLAHHVPSQYVEFWVDYSVRAVLTTGLPSYIESAAADRRILHASIKTTNTVAKELRIASWHWRQL